MAKIRTVKPELFRHEILFEAERHYHLPLRLAFIGLFSCCDREGRFRWEPRSLKLDILPYDEINFAEVLNALWEAGFIKKYTWQNKYYGHIPSWHQHQSINKHEPTSKLPNPEKCDYEICRKEVDTTSHVPPSAMRTDISDLHMHARASHESISALENHEECVVELPTHEQNQSLHVHASAKQISLSAIHESVSTCSTLTENLTTINKKQSNKMNIKNLENSLPATVCGVLVEATVIENQIFSTSESEMHMHACALHEDASAVHVHASLEVEMEEEVELEREQEVEKEKSLGIKSNIVAPTSSLGDNPPIVAQARRGLNKTAVSEIFDHWKITFQHPHAVLDKKRQRLIQQALRQGYTVAEICEAIRGCAQTPHNLGENERGQRYDGLHIILRDADQIERFMHNYHHPPRPPNAADQLLRANLTAGKNWLKRKQNNNGDLSNERSG